MTPETYFTVSVSTDDGYFSTTCHGKDCGGADLARIARYRPDLAPVVALHLSSLDGVPMHARDNALYWVSGRLSPALADALPFRPRTGERNRLASHLRISEDEADRLVAAIEETAAPTLALYRRRCVPRKAINDVVASAVTAFVDAQRERWADEARTAIDIVTSLPDVTR